MEKIDLTKKYKTYYSAKAKPELVEFNTAQYISITGKGDPSSDIFAASLQALYPVAYAVKFLCKEKQKDFVVPKLEGLWWFEETYKGLSLHDAPVKVPRADWCWRLLLRMPEYVTERLVQEAREKVFSKKKLELANTVKLFTMTERKAVQILHTGPFSEEPVSLKKLEEFIQENNLQGDGLHHEIYLSDFTKTAPEKLKTILREPVK